MSVEIPFDYLPVVRHLIAQGRFPNEAAVVAEGLRLISLREKLQDELQAGIAELDAGERLEASAVYAEAKRRIQAIEKQA